MSGVTKHIYNHEIRDILAMWDKQIIRIQSILPLQYSHNIIIDLLKIFYPHEWKSVEIKYEYYKTKDKYLKRIYGKNRYNMKKPEMLILDSKQYQKIQSSKYKKTHHNKYIKKIRTQNYEELLNERKSRIERIDNKIGKALEKHNKLHRLL